MAYSSSPAVSLASQSQMANRSNLSGQDASHPQRLAGPKKNVGGSERTVSLASGAILTFLGLGRRDLPGLAIAGLGGAMLWRGATGHCHAYQALDLSTAAPSEEEVEIRKGVHVTASFLINKPANELYAFWRNFENLPRFMTHLDSVRQLDERRSRWVAKAPTIYGGSVEWDAEITADEPNVRIAWQTLPDSEIQHRGSVTFTTALGARGTCVRAELEYQPPTGQVGRWIAKLFGEEPEQQIHDDLRNFKRIMEVGELPTIEGQSRGTCKGRSA